MKLSKKEAITTFKAFTDDMKCRDFQFEVGKSYHQRGDIKACDNGFHACESPLDVLTYYDLLTCRFAEVKQWGEIDKNNYDSKGASSDIEIIKELTLDEFIAVSIKHTAKDADSDNGDSAKLASSGNSAKLASSGNSAKLASSGDYAQLASSGDSAKLASSGDYAQLASSGDSAKLEVNGANSIAAGIGYNNKIKGKKGNWIVLAEYDDDGKVVAVESTIIDGKTIKEDTLYKLESGKFIEC